MLLLPCGLVMAQQGPAEVPMEVPGEATVSGPFIPVLTPALRDMPEALVDPNLFGVEAKKRDTHGIVVPEVDLPPHGNLLAEVQEYAASTNPEAIKAFATPSVNVEGLDYGVYPPDPTGDVGPSHVVQGVNGSSGSVVRILDKAGATVTSARTMESLASSAPCNSGYCDPIVQYDKAANRWLLTEFATSGNNLCVYVSTTSDPTGSYYAYTFGLSAFPDYPKYGVWPATGNSAYFVGANNGGTVIALQRDAMLAGNPASVITKSIGTLSGWSFQLTVPATHEGATPPPSSSGCIFMRPRDTEIHGGTCTNCDLMEMWEFKVDWATPANSTLTQLTSVQMADWDQTVCGTSQFGCMPQSGTSTLLDPIREPIHFPLQYRNFGTHETLVGAFVEDVDGTNKAEVHWFEIRRTPPGSGSWVKYQEGVLRNDTYHRGVASASMDGSGNIAVGYTRTSGSSYAGAYYAGRLSTDALGTLSSYDNLIQAGSSYQSSADRWGDYGGMGVDPADDCTFWYFGMYEEGSNNSATRIAAFKFDQCGSCTAPGAPTLSSATGDCNGVNLSWTAGSGTTNSYNVYRSTNTTCPVGTLTKLNSSPVTGTTYSDTTAVAGTTYTYVVRGACDASGATESGNSNCLAAARLATPAAPSGVTATSTSCSYVQVTWGSVSGATSYNVLRGTTCGTVVTTFTGVTSPYNDTSAVAGTTYQYWVVALNGTCSSASSSCATGTRLAVPSAPTGVGATTNRCTDVQVTWSSVTGASRYNVLRGTTCGTAVTTFTGVTSPYGDTTAVAGTTYQYWVVAVNSCGTSPNSSCASGTRLTTPAAPASVSATTNRCTDVQVTWGSVSGATSYNVLRGTACGTVVTTFTGVTSPYKDTTAVAGATYQYWVVALNGTCTSPNSLCAAGVRLVSPTPTISGDSANTCPATSVVLATESGQSNYQWYNGGSPIGGATSPFCTVTATGSYTVSYTNSSGCSGTSAAKAVTITACAPVIVYQGHGTFTEVTGDGDGVMEAGEKYSVSVTLANTGNVAASAVLASLSGMAAGDGITVCDNPGAFGDIAAGGTASATFTFVVNSSVWYGTYACGTSLTFNVVGKSTATPSCSCADQLGVFSNAVGASGGTVTLFPADDDPYNSGLWTFSSASNQTVSHCSRSTNYARINQDATMSLTTGISTVGYTGITVVFDHTGFNYDATNDRVELYWSTNGSTWTGPVYTSNSTSWQCGVSQALPAGAEGQGTLFIRFRSEGNANNNNERAGIDYVIIQGTGGATNCNTGAGTCAVSPNPKEASPSGTPMTSATAAGSSIDVTYTAACGATDHAIYWGSGPIAAALNWTSSACSLGTSGSATFDPGTPASGAWYYFVIVGQTATKEGSYGLATSGERPEAVGVGACDRTQDLTGTCP